MLPLGVNRPFQTLRHSVQPAFDTMKMTSLPAESRTRRFVALAALAVLATGFTQAQDTRPGRPALPEIALDRALNGNDAVAALGANLPAVAAHYGKTAAALALLFRTDRDLWTDQKGRLYFGDSHVPNPALAPTINDGAVSAAALVPLTDTFKLHSRPSATKKIYLDFDGHTTTGTSWNNTSRPSFVTPPYDIGDGSGTATFSNTELERIQYIWQRVAEDFAPFDVDVTTEDPGAAGLIKTDGADVNYGIRVCIGGSSYDWYGNGAGGVAYISSFDWNSDTPCFVFTAQLGTGNEKYTAEATSHEIGHTLDLYHDGRVASTTNSAEGYFQGHGNWAPIMGVGYYKNIVQFSKGEYLYTNNTEDDLAKITASYNTPYIPDDFGNSLATATPVAAGTVAVPGIISTPTDVDFFRFETGGGTLTFNIAVDSRSPNLNVEATLYNSAGTALAVSSPTTSMGTSFTASGLAAGTYYLKIDGVGEGDPASTGYSGYGSIGNYVLTGTVPEVPTNTPPTAPSSLSVAQACNTTNPSLTALAVNWQDNSSNETHFRLQWSADGSTWPDANQATTTASSYAQGSLPPGTTVYYRVRAENSYGESAWTSSASGTTHTLPTAAPVIAGTASSSSQINLSWAVVANATGYVVERSTDGNTWSVRATLNSGTTTSYADTGLAGSTTYHYRVLASGSCGYTTGPSNVVTVTTLTPPPAAPAAPANLTAKAASTTSINLAWSDRSADESGFYVERSSGSSGWVRIATLGANTTSYTATGLTRNTSYSFRVQSYNGNGASAYSNTATTKTRAK